MSDTALLASSESLNPLLGQLLEMGGPVMIVLIAIALVGAITFIYLILTGTLYAPRLSGRIKALVADWQQAPDRVRPDDLRRQAGRYARLNPLLHLVLDTIEARRQGRDLQQIRTTVARDAQQALEPFEAPLKIIEVIAALAPLLGLLGTVMGMMEAFSAMAATEGRANASQLSGGIYEAMTTTAAGLVIAIPFAALAAWVEFRLRRIHKTVNATLVTVLNQDHTGANADAPAAEPAPAKPDPSETRHQGRPRFAHATG